MKNRFNANARESTVSRGALVSVLIFAALFAFFCYSVQDVSATSATESTRRLETAVRHAVVHCYASEGQYPPDVAYLEKHYGLTYDKTRYYIDYQCFASNVMPDITVVSLRGKS